MFIYVKYLDKLTDVKTSSRVLLASVEVLNRHIDEYNKEKRNVYNKDLTLSQIVNHYINLDLHVSLIKSSISRITNPAMINRIDKSDVERVETQLSEIGEIMNKEEKEYNDIFKAIEDVRKNKDEENKNE